MFRLFIAAIGGGLTGALSLWLLQGNSFRLTPANMSYADMAATMLGAAGILLTALGLVIGILALWGYSQFRTMVEASAIEHVRQSVAEGPLKDLVSSTSVDFIKSELETGSLRKVFEDRLDEIILRDASTRATEENQPDTEFEEGTSDD